MSDLIKREDAIEAVRSSEFIFDSPQDGFIKHDVSGMVRAVLLEVLEALPSADAEWIPCSERLPSMRTEVIYSYDGIVGTGYMTDRDCIGEKTEEHWEDLEIGAYIEPIAWMPLPKPYKGGDTE